MRFNLGVISSVFCALGILLVCLNVVETITVLMSIFSWIFPDHDQFLRLWAPANERWESLTRVATLQQNLTAEPIHAESWNEGQSALTDLDKVSILVPETTIHGETKDPQGKGDHGKGNHFSKRNNCERETSNPAAAGVIFHTNHARSPAWAEPPRSLAACGGDFVSCGNIHGNCCAKSKPCCGLGCCPKGWHCEDAKEGICCEDGLGICGGVCAAGECCPGGLPCQKTGETCCGGPGAVLEGADHTSEVLLRCCTAAEYCYGGTECRLRPVEDSGASKAVVGGVLYDAFRRLWGLTCHWVYEKADRRPR